MLIGLLLVCGNAWATASSITDNYANGAYPSQNNGKNFQVVFSFTGDSTNGTFVSTACSAPIKGYVTRVVVNPGSTAPTASYDITLTTTNNGEDIMGGKLADRSASDTEAMRPYDSGSGTYGDVYVDGTVTLNISNNSINSATGTVTLYCERP
jgi:hypothetical protein